MHIRLATPNDLSSMASISVSCFWTDELYQYTNPWRDQYPNHFQDLFFRRFRLRYITPGWVFHVAVTDEGNPGHEDKGKVVGYSAWERRGTSEAAKKWQKDTYWKILKRTRLRAAESYTTLLRTDKSLDYDRLRHFYAEAADDFAAVPEIWKLQNLAVHPDFQRRGIASTLINWGKEQARNEGVPIGLESSLQARACYTHNGFRVFGEMHIKDFPIEDVPIFLWEPEGMEGRWGMKWDVGKE